MNYYAEGGQAHGLKTIAKSIQSHGRYGDTMLAHINPKEAEILKALGGSGTTNPVTGLKEYWGIGIGGVGIGSDYHGIGMKSGDLNLGGIAKGLGGIASDLGIVGQVAATAFGGPIGAALYAGLAANGGKSGSFDLKRAALAGALAYGAGELAKGVGDASGMPAAGSEAAPGVDAGISADGSGLAAGDAGATVGEVGTTGGTASMPTSAGVQAGPPTSAMSMGDKLAYNAGNMYDKAVTGISNYGSNVADNFTNLPANVDRFATGLGNLASGDPAAIEAFKASGATLSNTALPMYMGYTGSVALDEADKLKEESDAARALAESDLAEQRDRTEKSRLRGVAAMSSNPYMFANGGSVKGYAFGGEASATANADSGIANIAPSGLIGRVIANNPDMFKVVENSPEVVSQPQVSPDSLFGRLIMQNPEIFRAIENEKASSSSQVPSVRIDDLVASLNVGNNKKYSFAIGGEVPQLNNMPAGGLAGIQGMRDGYAPMITDRGDVPQFAKGGQPRFLSGGGDGMSDSIHATIEGKQEARLADGEFVIPADVVSHLGNGSSKAGAKQLYSMMDKVRSARTGTKKQGKQINPSKFMPA